MYVSTFYEAVNIEITHKRKEIFVAEGKKITRKELKQPDRFHSVAARVFQYIYENRQKFYLASGIAGLIVLLLVVWGLYHLNYERNANLMYSLAYNSHTLAGVSDDEIKTYEAAVKIYEELINKYPKSDAAKLAFYNTGNIYYSLYDVDKSIEAYGKFLKKSSKYNMLTSLAYYGLGYCYEDKKDFEKAIESFENSNKSIEGLHFASMNYANIARIYEKMGKEKKALEFYKKALEQTPDPLIEALVRNKVATLG